MGLTKAQLEALNISSFPDNTSELITPEILRTYNSASIANTVNQDTYTTDSASFDSRINNIVTGTGFVSTSSFNAYTSSTNGRLNNLETTTASLNSSITQLNASSASQQVSINNLNTTTASLLIETQNLELFSASALSSISQLNQSSASQQVSINSLNSATSSYVTETESGSFLLTASFDNSTRNLTFTKGNNTTFAVNIPDVSGSTINTGSFATTGSNTFTGQNTFSESVNMVSALNMYQNANINLGYPKIMGEPYDPNIAVSTPRVIGQSGSGRRLVLEGDSMQQRGVTILNGLGITGSVVISPFGGMTPQGGDLNVAGTFTSSLQQGYVWVGDASGRTATVATSSFGGGASVNTGSLMVTASASGPTITFTKGDNTQFSVSVATGSFVSASYAETSSITRNVVVVARNNNASTLPAGTVVHITSALGDNPVFTTASYDNEALSSNTFGLLRYSSAPGADVEVVVNGVVTGVNTDPALGYTAGDIVYLSSSGQFTNIQPQAPNQIVTLGQVLRAQQNNGSIYVSINNGWELNELHNVQINNPQTGDLLQYESASYGLWKNRSISGAGITSTSSFNAYTSSTNTRLTNIENTTASLLIETQNLELFSASALVSISNLNQSSASQQTSIDNLNAKTGSYATTGSNTFTGNQIVNADLTVSQSKVLRLGNNGQLRNDANGITLFDTTAGYQHRNFTSGDYYFEQNAVGGQMYFFNNSGGIAISGSFTSIQNINFIPFSASLNTRISSLVGVTGSYTTTASFNSYTSSTNGRLTNIESTTASLLIETQNLELFSASALISLSNLNTATASLFTSASLSLTTASVSGQTMTFRKGDGTTFNVTLPGGGTINTGSFATTGSNSFNGNQTITGSLLAHNVDKTALVVSGGFFDTVSFITTTSSLLVKGAQFIEDGSDSAGSQINATINLNSRYPGITLGQNIFGSGSQYPNVTLNVDTNTYVPSGGVFGGLTVNGSSVEDTIQMVLSSYTVEYTNNFSQNDGTAVILGGGNYNNPSFSYGSSPLSIGFKSGSIDIWKPTSFKAPVIITGSLLINGNSVLTGGSNSFNGNQTISGSLRVSGSTILQGNTTFIDRSGSNNNNVYMGDNALLNNTTGVNNFALGNNAMSQNTTGFQNVAIGAGALNSNTTGFRNVGIGNDSLFNNTTGNTNFALGFNSLKANVGGNSNVAIGGESGENASGSSNIFIGGKSGRFITGSANTIIGSYEGTVGTTLDNNIILADGVGNVRAQFSGSSWEFFGGIQVESGSNKPTGIVTANGFGVTVTNSLVTPASMIFLTPQSLDSQGNVEDRVSVYNKTSGSFGIITGNQAASVPVAYLIINPT